MFCPACSAEASDEQKYCRTCGMNLQPILPLVSEHTQSLVTQSKARSILKKIEYLGFGIGGAGIVLIAGMAIFALLALAFIGPEAKSMSALWSKLFGVGLLLILKGAFIAGAAWFCQAFFLSKARPVLTSAKTNELPAALPGEPLASITEHTTRNLEPVSSDRLKRPISVEL